MARPRILVLGAGPGGLGAATRLARQGVAEVTVLERNDAVGGNAGSFPLEGLQVDFGSHRLHPACDPEVLADLKALLGDDLFRRPRHGRIRLGGRWIRFPLRPLDLGLHLPWGFKLGLARDLLTKKSASSQGGGESFASVMEKQLGRTICQDFYFPYARKIWGMAPEEISATQAHKRVSANSPGKMIRKALSSVPGLKPKNAGFFYYPRGGYGQISEALAAAATTAGAEIHLGTEVQSIRLQGSRIESLHAVAGGSDISFQPDQVWSTIPAPALIRLLGDAVPDKVVAAARALRYRAMVLIYVALDEEQFTEYDAHYFPQRDIRITRLSEPKNYAAVGVPAGHTVLCAELPCSLSDPEWEMSAEDLGLLVRRDLERAGIPVRSRVRSVSSRRLPYAYPIYELGYDEVFGVVDGWVDTLENLLAFGRQALFAHDNTHHTMFMAYSAVKCLGGDGSFDRRRWAEMRQVFETHVVED